MISSQFDLSSFKGITLGYFTDTHFRFQNPIYRKDKFKESIMNKLGDVKNILSRYQVDAILHGGDMFDIPTVDQSTWVAFGAQLLNFGVPIYALPGNHDMEGHNVLTVPNTPIDHLSKLGVFSLIMDNKEEPFVIKKNGISVQITGRSFHNFMDIKYKEEDYVLKNKKADYAIHMVHGNLLDKPIIELAHFTLIDEIKHTLADVTLSGHYHMGFPLTKIVDNGMEKYFYNPGGFVRKTVKEMKRMPTFTLIFISEQGIHIEDIPLPSALPAEEVLDLEKMERKKNSEQEVQELIHDLRSKATITKSISLREMIDSIGSQKNIEQPVKDAALHFIQQARIAINGGEVDELD
jgi:exonuclease SbcD